MFINDVAEAITEARWARENGLMGISLPGDHVLGLTNLYYPSLDPLWATCVELDLPVHRHGIIAAEAKSEATGVGAPAVGAFECFYLGRRAIAHLILGAVFERFPGLKFVTAELNSAWAVEYAAMLDYYMDEASIAGTIPNMFASDSRNALSLKPSEYFLRNCYYGTFFTKEDVAARHKVGVNRMMWGADFPHHEGTTPFSREALRVNFAGWPEDEVRMMLGGAAAECYGFDMIALGELAEHIGPSVADVASPLPIEQYPAYPDETVCGTFADALGRGYGGRDA